MAEDHVARIIDTFSNRNAFCLAGETQIDEEVVVEQIVQGKDAADGHQADEHVIGSFLFTFSEYRHREGGALLEDEHRPNAEEYKF